MDISKIKDVVGKLGFLRSYSSLVLPVVIASVGIAVLAGAYAMGIGFRMKVERQSVPIGREIATLAQGAPSRAQVDVEKEYARRYETDRNRMNELILATTRRELLSYRMFPSPKDTSMQIFSEFGQLYCRGIEGLIQDVNGRDCPSETELEAATQKAAGGSTMRLGSRFGTMGGTEGAIVDALCRERAESAAVYVSPSGIAGYDFWKNYQYSDLETGVKDCWYWQVGYWIIEDVFQTIKTLNAGSVNVYTSPVKRLMTVNFSSAGRSYGGGKKARAEGERPSYAVGGKNLLAHSPTGRLSNDKMDVVHFDVVVLVNAERVLEFMKALCSAKQHVFRGYSGQETPRTGLHNQITILESRTRSINPQDPAHRLYRYGLSGVREDAIVEIELICEYVFIKDGYEELKPEAVKADLVEKQQGQGM